MVLIFLDSMGHVSGQKHDNHNCSHNNSHIHLADHINYDHYILVPSTCLHHGCGSPVCYWYCHIMHLSCMFWSELWTSAMFCSDSVGQGFEQHLLAEHWVDRSNHLSVCSNVLDMLWTCSENWPITTINNHNIKTTVRYDSKNDVFSACLMKTISISYYFLCKYYIQLSEASSECLSMQFCVSAAIAECR